MISAAAALAVAESARSARADALVRAAATPRRWVAWAAGRLAAPEGRALAAAVVDLGREMLRDETADILRRAADAEAWEAAVAPTVAAVHAGATLATLGRPALAAAESAALTSAVLGQLVKLGRFAAQVRDGAAAIGRAALARIALYGSAAWGTAQAVARRAALARGKTMEARVLGEIASAHCPECPALAAMGWVPIGTLPPIGDTQCRVHCACWFDFA